jgi:hypothetical protein
VSIAVLRDFDVNYNAVPHALQPIPLSRVGVGKLIEKLGDEIEWDSHTVKGEAVAVNRD